MFRDEIMPTARASAAHSDRPCKTQNAATHPMIPTTINVQQMRFQNRQLVSGLKNLDPAPYCRNKCSTSEQRRFRLSSAITISDCNSLDLRHRRRPFSGQVAASAILVFE